MGWRARYGGEGGSEGNGSVRRVTSISGGRLGAKPAIVLSLCRFSAVAVVTVVVVVTIAAAAVAATVVAVVSVVAVVAVASICVDIVPVG